MLTINECKKICPELNDLSEEEVLAIRDTLYVLGQLALEVRPAGSKNPIGEVPKRVEDI